jgi:hypothetical protein
VGLRTALDHKKSSRMICASKVRKRLLLQILPSFIMTFIDFIGLHCCHIVDILIIFRKEDINSSYSNVPLLEISSYRVYSTWVEIEKGFLRRISSLRLS